MDEQIVSTPTLETEVEITPPPAQPHRVTLAVKSQMFLTAAILMSISVGVYFVSTLAAGNLSVDIFQLLIMIGMWVAYSNASKTPDEKAIPANGLNMISGTVKALRIVSLVLSIIFIVCAVICIAVGAFVGQNEAVFDSFKQGYLEGIGANSVLTINGSALFDLRDLVKAPDVAMTFMIIMGVVFLVFAIILLVVFYFLFLKTLHRFTYSVCENVKYGTPIEKANSAWAWLFVLGILSAIFSLGNPLVNGPGIAAEIIAALIIRKYIAD